jgi:hypothetical protein
MERIEREVFRLKKLSTAKITLLMADRRNAGMENWRKIEVLEDETTSATFRYDSRRDAPRLEEGRKRAICL